jgi:Kef-type K+ transport system membrane component KefB
MENLLYFSVLLMAGFITGKFVNILKLPSVTGYLLSGIIIGPYGFNIIPFNFIESMDFLKSVALAFIAFSIGSEFETTVLKKLGKSVFIVTIIQALAASLMVIVVMFFIFDQSLSLSLLLGAIAAATAPAATVMVIKQYEAKGPLTQTLLSVVALDDAVCVILFGVMLTIIKSLSSTGSEGNITLMLLHPFLEIIGSFALGMGASILTIILLKLTRSREEIAVIGSAVVIGASVLAEKLGFSLLLTSMVLGGILANTTPNIRKIFSATSNITPPRIIYFRDYHRTILY